MCEPTTILMASSLAVSALSAGVSYDSGRKTANQQADTIKTANDLQALDTAREHEIRPGIIERDAPEQPAR